MTKRDIYNCFISSPGDCQEERVICEKVISELNKGLASQMNINFETITWEKDILPDMATDTDGQEIIDKYVESSNYDIFIGIMKYRYGRPTKKAGSGTEHEFNNAIERKSNENNIPQILFFFGNEKISPDELDFEQFSKVKEFKKKCSSKGLYTEFNNKEEFRQLLKQKLELFVKEKISKNDSLVSAKIIDNSIQIKLEEELRDSLKIYNEESPTWIEPIISTHKEVPDNPTKNNQNRISIESIINGEQNIIIKAPSEFGLTSLAHYLKLEAWKKSKKFVYIDIKKTKKHKIIKDIELIIREFYKTEKDKIDCILLDSVCFEENGVMQILKVVCEEFSTRLIIFNTLDSNFFIKSDEDEKININRDFISLFLLPLLQNDVRKIVTSYSRKKELKENEETILQKVTKDLEILNLHRTPKNCISILRASSKIENEYSPINRTKLLEIILNTIFEESEIPTYRDQKPDIKDCIFILGYFCQDLVMNNNFEFSEKYFNDVLSKFCAENYITLDIKDLFSVLHSNLIIEKKSSDVFFFKNSYWFFYFLANRMAMDKSFLEYVYNNKKYIDYPEVIEFYTGIDRNREDALITLCNDIEETIQLVKSKVNIPDEINPYNTITCNPDPKILEKENAKIGNSVLNSSLPDEVKDRYDDKSYNQIRPYNQVINTVMRNYSFLVLMQQISASSRALRNSDFVNPSVKKRLFNSIMQAWNEVNKLLIILSPILAEKGRVAFEGASFFLDEDDFNFYNEIEKKKAVLLAVPTNVVKFFKDDLYSTKMSTLLFNLANEEKNKLLRHEIMILIATECPPNWFDIIDKYILSLNKNSFYLADIHIVLKTNLSYKVNIEENRGKTIYLIKKCIAKYKFNEDNPNPKLINKIKID